MNNSFNAGFLKQAQARGLSFIEAERLLKEAGLRQWWNNTTNNIGEDLGLFAQQYGRVPTSVSALGSTIAPWNWGDNWKTYGENVNEINTGYNTERANRYLNRFQNRLAQGDGPEARSSLTQMNLHARYNQDPVLDQHLGNQVNSTIAARQQQQLASKQNLFDRQQSSKNLATVVNQPFDKPFKPTGMTPGVGMQFPKPLPGALKPAPLGVLSGRRQIVD